MVGLVEVVFLKNGNAFDLLFKGEEEEEASRWERGKATLEER